MKKIASIVLLYAIASMHAYAADNNVYALLKMETETQDMPAYETRQVETRQFIVERIEALSKFSLLQVSDNFSVYGKLSFPRISRDHADSGIHHDSATYGLRSQFNTIHGIGIRFGWDRYIAGQNTSDNLYSLTAVVKF